MIFGTDFGTNSLENEIRDPIPKKNDIGDDFSPFLIDFGIPWGGPGEAFFLKNGWRLLSFLVFLCFLLSRGGSGRHFLVFSRLQTPFLGIRGPKLGQKLV